MKKEQVIVCNWSCLRQKIIRQIFFFLPETLSKAIFKFFFMVLGIAFWFLGYTEWCSWGLIWDAKD